MRQTIRLGHVRGIAVGLHWSVLVIALLLTQSLAAAILPERAPGHGAAVYWPSAVLVSLIFLLTLLVHELSHALVARRHGVGVRRITLWLLGGVAELDGEPPNARADLLIALAGPAASLACAGVFGAGAVTVDALGGPRLVVTGLAWLGLVNALLAVFNLLPGAPLDGGRVLRAAWWWWRGDPVAAARVAGRAGFVLGLVLAGLGFAQLWLDDLSGLWLVLLGWFLAAAARAEDTAAALRHTLGALTVGDAMSSPAACGYTTETVDSFLHATARHHPYTTYPVLGLDGRLAGLVTLGGLGRVPPERRSVVKLQEAQVSLDRLVVLDPSTRLADVAGEVLVARPGLAPVAVHGRLCGVLTAADIDRIVKLTALNALPEQLSGTRGR
jgi:Zn-dependent protease